MELPLDTHLAFLLRGKAKNLDLYLDFAAAQLDASDADYWKSVLPNWAENDSAGVATRAGVEQTAAAILEGIVKNPEVLQDMVSIRAKLRASPKFQKLVMLSERLTRTFAQELKAQPDVAGRFHSAPPKLSRLVQARRAVATIITK
jgi:hypothetical protein